MSGTDRVTEHYAAHVARQQAVWEAALDAEGFDSAVVHSGSQLLSFMDDYHYPFRPNPHFLAWLPLTRHDECVLIVRPGHKPVLSYYQPDDYWYLPPADPEPWWAELFEVFAVREAGEWREHVPVGREAYIGDAPELAGEDDHNPPRLVNRLHLARTRKTPYELDCMRAANRRAVLAHRAAEQAFRAGDSEFAIHQRYLDTAQLSDAQLPYASIVALNEHAAVLHYQQRDRLPPESRHSFLIDAGATTHGYAADITRTFAAHSGDFAALIEALDAVQLALCAEVRAGVDYRDLHLAAHRHIAGLLAEAGIIKVPAEEAVSSGLSGVFFPHGLGHYLGLQTHDVAGLIADEDGTPIPRPPGHPFLRLTRTLEEGNVLTVEPGIYFIDSLLERWRHRHGDAGIDWTRVAQLRPCGGIRIEDNVVVTSGDPENLTRDAAAALAADA